MNQTYLNIHTGYIDGYEFLIPELSSCLSNYSVSRFSLTKLVYNLMRCVQVPMATRPSQLIIPMAGLGFAIGMVDR